MHVLKADCVCVCGGASPVRGGDAEGKHPRRSRSLTTSATIPRRCSIPCPPAVKQDLLLAFVDCVERSGAKLARQRLQLEVLPSILPPPGGPGGGMAGSIIDVPALPQPVDVTATAATSGGSGAPGGSGSGGAPASNIVPTAGKEGSGGGGSGGKEGGSGSVTVTVASTSGATAQQELAAQAAAATAAAVLSDPATLSKIAAAISPDVSLGWRASQRGASRGQGCASRAARCSTLLQSA